MSTTKGTSGRLDYKLLGFLGGMFCLYFHVLSLIAQQCFTFFLTTFLLNNAMALHCKHYAYHFLHFLLAHFFAFVLKVVFAKISQLSGRSLTKFWSTVAKSKHLFSSLASLSVGNLKFLLRKCKQFTRKLLFWKVEVTEDKRALISNYSNKTWQKRKIETFSTKNYDKHLELSAYQEEIKYSQNLYQKLIHDLNTINNDKVLNNMTLVNNYIVGNFQIMKIKEVNFIEASRTQIDKTQANPGPSNGQPAAADTADFDTNSDSFSDKEMNTPKNTFTPAFDNGVSKRINGNNFDRQIIKKSIIEHIKNKRLYLNKIKNGSYNRPWDENMEVDTQNVIITKCSRNGRHGEGFLSKEKRKFKWKKRHKEYMVFDVKIPHNTLSGKVETVVEKTAVEENALKETAVKETVLEKTVVKETAVKETAVKETAVKKTAVTTIEKTAVKKMAVEETAVKKTSLEDSAVKETAVEKTFLKEIGNTAGNKTAKNVKKETGKKTKHKVEKETEEELTDDVEDIDEESKWFKTQYEKSIGKPTEPTIPRKKVLKRLKCQAKGCRLWSPTARGYRDKVYLKEKPLELDWGKSPRSKFCTCPLTECTCEGNSLFPPQVIPKGRRGSLCIRLLHEAFGCCCDGVLGRCVPAPARTLMPRLTDAIVAKKARYMRMKDLSNMPPEFCASGCKNFFFKTKRIDFDDVAGTSITDEFFDDEDGTQEEDKGAGKVKLYGKDDNIYERDFILTISSQTEYDASGRLLLEDTDRVITPFAFRYKKARDLEGKEMKIEEFQYHASPTSEFTLQNLLHVPDIQEQMCKMKKGIEGTLKTLSWTVSSYKRNWQSCFGEMGEQISLYAKDLHSRVKLGIGEEKEEASHKCNQTDESVSCCCNHEHEKGPKQSNKYYESLKEAKSNARPTKGISWPDLKSWMRYDECNQTESLGSPAKNANDDVLTMLENYIHSLKPECKRIIDTNADKSEFHSKSNRSNSLTETKINNSYPQSKEDLARAIKQNNDQLSKKILKREGSSGHCLQEVCHKNISRPSSSAENVTKRSSCKDIDYKCQDSIEVTTRTRTDNAKQTSSEIVLKKESSLKTASHNVVACKRSTCKNINKKIVDAAKTKPDDSANIASSTGNCICDRTVDAVNPPPDAVASTVILSCKSIHYKSQDNVNVTPETVTHNTKQTCSDIARKTESSVKGSSDNVVNCNNAISENINTKIEDAPKTTPTVNADSSRNILNIINGGAEDAVKTIPEANTAKLYCEGMYYKSQSNVKVTPATVADNAKQIYSDIDCKTESYINGSSDNVVDCKNVISKKKDTKIEDAAKTTPAVNSDSSRNTSSITCGRTEEYVETKPDTVASTAKLSCEGIDCENKANVKDTTATVPHNAKQICSDIVRTTESFVNGSSENVVDCKNTTIENIDTKIEDGAETTPAANADSSRYTYTICSKTGNSEITPDTEANTAKLSSKSIHSKNQDSVKCTYESVTDNAKQTCSDIVRKRENSIKAASDNVVDCKKVTSKNINNKTEDAEKTIFADNADSSRYTSNVTDSRTENATETSPDTEVSTGTLSCDGIDYKSQDDVQVTLASVTDNAKQTLSNIVHEIESFVKGPSDIVLDCKNVDIKIEDAAETTPVVNADSSKYTSNVICGRTGDTAECTPDTTEGNVKISCKDINYISQDSIRVIPGSLTHYTKQTCSKISRQTECSVKASSDNLEDCKNTISTNIDVKIKDAAKATSDDIAGTAKPSDEDICGETNGTVKIKYEAVIPSCKDIIYATEDNLKATTGTLNDIAKQTSTKMNTMSDNVTDGTIAFCKNINGISEEVTIVKPDARADSVKSNEPDSKSDDTKVIMNIVLDGSITSFRGIYDNTEDTVKATSAAVLKAAESSEKCIYERLSGITETPRSIAKENIKISYDSSTTAEYDNSLRITKRYDVNSTAYSNGCPERSSSWPVMKPWMKCDKCKRVIVPYKKASGTNTTENDIVSGTGINFGTRYCQSKLNKLQKDQEVTMVENRAMTALDEGMDAGATGRTTPDAKEASESKCNYIAIKTSTIVESVSNVTYAKDDNEIKDNVKSKIHGAKSSKITSDEENLSLHKDSKLYYCIKPKTRTFEDKTNSNDDNKLIETSPYETKVKLKTTDIKNHTDSEYDAGVNSLETTANKESGKVYYRFRPKSKAEVNSATTMDETEKNITEE